MDYNEVRKRKKGGADKAKNNASELRETSSPVRTDYEMRRYYTAAGVLSVVVIILGAALFLQTFKSMEGFVRFVRNISVTDMVNGLSEPPAENPAAGNKSGEEYKNEEAFKETASPEVYSLDSLPTVEPPNTYQ